MDIGVTLRNMGPQSAPEIVAECAQAADSMGFESIWITDHIAIPPDDAEGSGGRYLDTLTTLAWLAGITKQAKLGSGVLILPYRAALPTAKQIATLQEVSQERLLLGVGIGWMDAEFRALGVDRHARGSISDRTIEFFNACFANDVVEANGQPFLFKPRPAKPPILIGGRAPHALDRAAKLADGWFPMVSRPEDLLETIPAYHEKTDALGRAPGTVTAMTSLPLSAIEEAGGLCDDYRAAGVNRLVCAIRYDTPEQYRVALERLASVRDALGDS
jgi:probable F420-dependent oxidoreductase